MKKTILVSISLPLTVAVNGNFMKVSAADLHTPDLVSSLEHKRSHSFTKISGINVPTDVELADRAVASAKGKLIEQAESAIREGKKRFPNSTNVRVAEAFVLFTKGSVSRNAIKRDLYLTAATSLCENTLKLDPSNFIGNQTLGLINEALNKPLKAVALFRKCLATAKTPENLTNLARSLFEVDPSNHEGHLLILESAALEPNYAPALLELAANHVAMGDLKSADSDLKRISNGDRSSRWSLIKGKLDYKQNLGESALTSWNRALSLDPFLPEAYQCIASYYSGIGNEDLAVEELFRGLDALPENESLKDALLKIAQKTNNNAIKEKILRDFRFNDKQPDQPPVDPGVS